MHPAIAHLLATARPILDEYGYAGLFVCNLTEGFGIPLPGETLLVGGAILATTGDFDIRLVVPLAFIATVLGNCVGYLIGRTGGRALLLRCRIPTARLERVESFFAGRGALVVVIARFLDGLRQTAPLVAGSLQMPWWRFFGASMVGAAIWVGVWGLGVYLVGAHLHGVLAGLHRLARHGWWITALALIVVALWLVQRKQRT
ncbi:MAG: DedA family protein [Gammaproteobacteria bacterium]|nr:DedA family protein [Gammaproteobacteria bacterium]